MLILSSLSLEEPQSLGLLVPSLISKEANDKLIGYYVNSAFYLQIPIPCPEQYLCWLPWSHRSHVWTTSPSTAGEGSGPRQTLGSKSWPLGDYSICSECYMFLSEKVSHSRCSPNSAPQFPPRSFILPRQDHGELLGSTLMTNRGDSSATQQCRTSMPTTASPQI